VDIIFNEPSITVPVMELKASNGSISAINNLVSSDNGIHWSGSLDASALAEGQAEFILKEAKDGLGNTGTTVKEGRTILLYRDSVPPPAVPEGLT